MKDTRRTTILTSIVCLLPIAAGLLLYDRLPETIPTHFDFAGNPNGWSSRFTAVVVLPGILFLVNLLFPLLLKTDPKYENISEKVKALIHWIIPAVALFCSAATLSAGLGINPNLSLWGPVFVGLILTIIGNYLPKMSQSYTVGIKIPWTLADEENWDKTHRMAGFLWTAGGILIIISAFTPASGIALILIMLGMVIIPMIYSYLLFRKKNAEG